MGGEVCPYTIFSPDMCTGIVAHLLATVVSECCIAIHELDHPVTSCLSASQHIVTTVEDSPQSYHRDDNQCNWDQSKGTYVRTSAYTIWSHEGHNKRTLWDQTTPPPLHPSSNQMVFDTITVEIHCICIVAVITQGIVQPKPFQLLLFSPAWTNFPLYFKWCND